MISGSSVGRRSRERPRSAGHRRCRARRALYGVRPTGRRASRASRDKVIAKAARTGYADGRATASMFAWIRPNEGGWLPAINNYLLGNDPPAFDLLFWAEDATNVTAALQRDMLEIALANGFAQLSPDGEPARSRAERSHRRGRGQRRSTLLRRGAWLRTDRRPRSDRPALSGCPAGHDLRPRWVRFPCSPRRTADAGAVLRVPVDPDDVAGFCGSAAAVARRLFAGNGWHVMDGRLLQSSEPWVLSIGAI